MRNGRCSSQNIEHMGQSINSSASRHNAWSINLCPYNFFAFWDTICMAYCCVLFNVSGQYVIITEFLLNSLDSPPIPMLLHLLNSQAFLGDGKCIQQLNNLF